MEADATGPGCVTILSTVERQRRLEGEGALRQCPRIPSIDSADETQQRSVWAVAAKLRRAPQPEGRHRGVGRRPTSRRLREIKEDRAQSGVGPVCCGGVLREKFGVARSVRGLPIKRAGTTARSRRTVHWGLWRAPPFQIGSDHLDARRRNSPKWCGFRGQGE